MHRPRGSRMVVRFSVIVAACASVLVSACTPPVYHTIEWEPDGFGFVQFSTDDPQYLDTRQYLPLTEESQSPMTTVTATVKKMSGYSKAGFGIVYCYQDENNFYLLEITTEGKFKVRKKVGGTDTDLIPWTTSTYLTSGFGVENDIGVTQDPVGTFSVTLNGTADVATFDDPSFTGGLAGPFVRIRSGAYEKFPGVPVDCRFKILEPVAYP